MSGSFVGYECPVCKDRTLTAADHDVAKARLDYLCRSAKVEIESATRAKVEAERAQRTVEAVEAARREERDAVLSELDVMTDEQRVAYFRFRSRLRGEKP
jgi:hypothetical protein